MKPSNVVVLIALVIGFTAVFQQPQGPRSRATPENFASLRVGMTRGEVLMTLGSSNGEVANPTVHPRAGPHRRPDGYLFADGGFFVGTFSRWLSPDCRREYLIAFRNDRATGMVCVYLDRLRPTSSTAGMAAAAMMVGGIDDGPPARGEAYDLRGNVTITSLVK